jgi:hypothetical protein
VASTGILPGPLDIALDLDLPPNVRKCCHAMALDEGRVEFGLDRVKPHKGTQPPAGTIEEVWFRGCHSDIGGGDQHDKLANIPLGWMFRRAADAGLSFDEAEVAAALAGRDRGALIIRSSRDMGLLKRKVKKSDTVHCSVRMREKVKKDWYVNPPLGCAVVGDAGEPRRPFPQEDPWPVDLDWNETLRPRGTLAVGGPPVRVEVYADSDWNEFPNVFLEKGGRYEFSVVDGPHDWIDGDVTETNGAEGYELGALKPFKRFARFPEAPWYSLIGAVDRSELFKIGKGVEYQPQKDGEFGCFANDAWFKYGNNRGKLTLSVTRIA